MPATAGRVRMPANNRVHSSAALQTHGIWQNAIGYDPYAPSSSHHKSSSSEPETENTYACFQQLLSLARITGSSCAQEAPRGTCKKCGRVGHLTFQCRNFLSVLKDENMDKNPNEVHAPVLCEVDKLKGKGIEVNGKTAEESSEEEESESSDSDYDSEIERVIAERNGTRVSSKLKLSRKKKVDFDEDGSDIEKSGRSKRRRKERVESDENESGRKRRKGEKKRREMSSDEDDERRGRKWKSRKEKSRRNHRHSEKRRGGRVKNHTEKTSKKYGSMKKRSSFFYYY